MTQEINVIEEIVRVNSFSKNDRYRCNINETTYEIVIPDNVQKFLIEKAGCKARDHFINNYYKDMVDALKMFYVTFHIDEPPKEECCYRCGGFCGAGDLTFGLCEECARDELGDEWFSHFKN